MTIEPQSPSVPRLMAAELIGTFFLVFFGCGAVHTAVLCGAQQGLWQVAVVWGVAIMLAIYAVGGISGAHINPSITLAFALWRGFPKRHVVPYIVAQVAGAVLAAASLFVLFGPLLAAKEQAKGVVRGEPGSVVTAMCYGEYFPNPGELAGGSGPFSLAKFESRKALVPAGIAFAAELLGTLVLGFVVFAVTDERNHGRPSGGNAAIFIGLTIAVLISVLAPLTQACFNPARDFGPRLFAYFAGWGNVAIPRGDYQWLLVYVVAPVLGAAAGSSIYELGVRPAFARAGDSMLPRSKKEERMSRPSSDANFRPTQSEPADCGANR